MNDSMSNSEPFDLAAFMAESHDGRMAFKEAALGFIKPRIGDGYKEVDKAMAALSLTYEEALDKITRVVKIEFLKQDDADRFDALYAPGYGVPLTWARITLTSNRARTDTDKIMQWLCDVIGPGYNLDSPRREDAVFAYWQDLHWDHTGSENPLILDVFAFKPGSSFPPGFEMQFLLTWS